MRFAMMFFRRAFFFRDYITPLVLEYSDFPTIYDLSKRHDMLG